MVLITKANSEGLGKPAHPRGHATAVAVRSQNICLKQRAACLTLLSDCACAFIRSQTARCRGPFSHEILKYYVIKTKKQID